MGQALKLIALDKDDLEVLSAHMQDSEVKISDVFWLPKEKRLVIGCDRFDWLAANCQTPEFRRCRTGLRFERVFSCKARGIDPTRKDAVLTLLAVDFVETDAPGGEVILAFEGDKALRLQVECLEAEIADIGPHWNCQCPQRADVLPTEMDAPEVRKPA
jgi:Protein of unknown function (DUF2948)